MGQVWCPKKNEFVSDENCSKCIFLDVTKLTPKCIYDELTEEDNPIQEVGGA